MTNYGYIPPSLSTIIRIVNLPHTPLKMLSRQALLRARIPALRNAVQRRFASTDGLPKLEGAMDNAFNRERQAVKAHAAKSAGEFPASLTVLALRIESDVGV